MKKIVLIAIIILTISSNVLATEVFNSSEFVNVVKEYSTDYMPELSSKNFINDVLVGNVDISTQNIFNKILNYFIKDFKNNISLLAKIIGIAFLCSIIKNIQSASEGNTAEIAFYACYMVIIILIVSSFSGITGICIKSIKKLSEFMNLLIPVIITLLVSMGNIATVATLQPIILAMVSIISSIISNLVIPIILISTVMSVISNISMRINIEKLSKFMRKSAMYVVEISMIIFTRISFTRRNTCFKCRWNNGETC